jgi:hypothetical protein
MINRLLLTKILSSSKAHTVSLLENQNCSIPGVYSIVNPICGRDDQRTRVPGR